MTTAAATTPMPPTSLDELDRKVRAVHAKAEEWARLPVAEKARLLTEMLPLLRGVAPEWAEAARRVKGIAPGTAPAAEDWLTGPVITLRTTRLLRDTLQSIAETGEPPRPRLRTRPDGRVEAAVFPTNTLDKMLFAGFTVKTLMQPGLDEQAVRDQQAAYYREKNPKPSTALVLGAGNVSSIPPLDAFTKMFGEGRVCVLKMNPVNDYVGPFLERALAPLISRGYLAICYGGGDVGKFLVEHPAIDDIHITGSDKTHDLIVWGPPGEERERRKRDKQPLLDKTITSELGNVSPVAIVPGDYSDDELRFVARNVLSMVQNNASFNCNAAKMLILCKQWPQAERFRELLREGFRSLPVRRAYYPGAADRFNALVGGHAQAERYGSGDDGTLPWGFIPGVDAQSSDEPLYYTEPFCSILSQTDLDTPSDAVAFLDAATKFMNERLWGTLNAMLAIHPRDEAKPEVAAALDRAVLDLRYGTVGINHWPAVGYALGSPPWGGHPSSTLEDIQSGTGWVHNSYLLEGLEKTVLRGPLVARPTPAWFYDHKTVAELARKMADFELSPSVWKVPSLALTALKG